ncbi:MAG: DUF6273 domain-containing protein [Oscillospiraceae bacterium]|nr:DUF6273 domain-containing protein [Oscillospiraceae bacterium]
MKKLVSVVLILSLVFTLAACGSEPETEQIPDPRPTAESFPTVEIELPDVGDDDSVVPPDEPETHEDPETPEEPVEISIEVGNIIPFGDYDWLILDVQDGKALIITENIIEMRAFSHEYEMYISVGWEESDLRAYLNDEFYNSFNESDREKIVRVTNDNPDNPWLVALSENDTENYIFLLSLDEVLQYFGDSGQLYYNLLDEPMVVENEGFPTTEWWFDDERDIEIDDEYNSARIAYDYNGEAQKWWLRTPARLSGGGAAISEEGYIDVCGFAVGRASLSGVRPAMWISIES